MDEKIKHQNGVAPSPDDEKKLNEFASWLKERGFKGVMFLNKDNIGVSWVAGSENSIFNCFANSLDAIAREDAEITRHLLRALQMIILRFSIFDRKGDKAN